MERWSGRRHDLERAFLRQHAESGRVDVAARNVSRATASSRTAIGRNRRSVPLGLSFGCLQALRQGGLPRGMPDRRDHAYRYRLGAGAKRCLQWLRILRGYLSLRRDRPAPDGWTRIQMYILLRPAKGRPYSCVREGVSNAVDSVRRAE